MADSTASTSCRRGLLAKLALSLASCLLCLGAFEAVLRVAGYGDLEVYEPDTSLYWRLKPTQNCVTKVGRKPVHINSQGTRGPEFEMLKPSRTLRVLSLGDSRTFGWGLTEDETYSYQLQVLLQDAEDAGRRVEVINAGVNAWSYPQMLAYFRVTGSRFEPDVVVLGEANLWTQFSEKSSAEFVRAFMWRVRLKNLMRRFALYHWVVEVRLREFYERYRTRFIPVDPNRDSLFKDQQQSDSEAVIRSAIEALCKAALASGTKPVLLYVPTLDDLGTVNNSVVLKVKNEISASLGVPLVDVAPYLKPLGKSAYLDADPVHLDPRGNRIVARQLFEAVNHMAQP